MLPGRQPAAGAPNSASLPNQPKCDDPRVGRLGRLCPGRGSGGLWCRPPGVDIAHVRHGDPTGDWPAGASTPGAAAVGHGDQAWWTVLRWAGAALAVLALAWFSYTRNGWVPLLSGADFGIHEFGHLLFSWAPPLVVYLSGSAVQVAVPACLAIYFLWRGDRLGTVLALGWLGVSLNSVSVYIADSIRRVLPLWGDDGSGDNHDWNNILFLLGWLHRTDSLAALVRAASAVAFLGALALAGWFAYRDLRPQRRPSASGLPIVYRP